MKQILLAATMMLLIAISIASLAYGFIVALWFLMQPAQAADLNRKSDRIDRWKHAERYGQWVKYPVWVSRPAGRTEKR